MVDLFTEVDGLSADDAALWMQLADIARRRGVSKAAISKRVKRLEADGLLSARREPSGAVFVDVAAFDRLTQQETIREDRSSKPPRKESGGAASAQTLKLNYEAALKALDFAERTKQLVLASEVEAAARQCCEAMLHALGMFLARAGELVSAVHAEGEGGARKILRATTDQVRASMAKALADLASSQTGVVSHLDISLSEHDAPASASENSTVAEAPAALL